MFFLAFFICLLPVLLALLLWSRTLALLPNDGATAPPPRWLLPVATLSGGACGLLVALLGQELGELLLPASATRPPGIAWLAARITMDAAAEEVGKALLLIALIAFGVLRDRLHLMLAGLVAGASFACVENVAFVLVSFGEGDSASWMQLISVRLPVSTLLHPAASALVTLGAGMMMRRGLHTARHVPRGIGLVASAWWLHVCWNLALTVSDLQVRPALALMALPIPVLAAAMAGQQLRRLALQKSSR